jgi:hypothetical protein
MTTTTAPSTITVRILSVASGAEIPDDVSTEARLDAMDTGRPCFVLFEGAGGDGEDVWCRYEALVLFDAATRLDAMDTGRPCFVLFEGAGGDGEDVWCRCEIVTD